MLTATSQLPLGVGPGSQNSAVPYSPHGCGTQNSAVPYTTRWAWDPALSILLSPSQNPLGDTWALGF